MTAVAVVRNSPPELDPAGPDVLQPGLAEGLDGDPGHRLLDLGPKLGQGVEHGREHPAWEDKARYIVCTVYVHFPHVRVAHSTMTMQLGAGTHPPMNS